MFNIEEKINEYLSKMFSSVVDFFIKLLSGIVDLISEQLPIIKSYYNIFIAFAGVLLVSVILVRIITTMLREADESADVSWANIITSGLKACASIPIMLFVQKWLTETITLPLAKYIFSTNKEFTSDSIKGTTEVYILPTQKIEMGAFVTILFILFFVIVLGFFFWKISIFIVNLAYFNLAIPFVGISIATENMDYSKEWWQKLLYSNVTLLSQVLSLSVMVYGFTHLSDGLLSLMMLIGGGATVLTPPFIIDSIWTSSGMTKPMLRGATSMIKAAMLFRR